MPTALFVARHEDLDDPAQTIVVADMALTIEKVDHEGALLDGAAFDLCREVGWTIECDGQAQFRNDLAGVFSLETLAPGSLLPERDESPPPDTKR